MLNPSASLAMSTSVLKALPGKLNIKNAHLVFSIYPVNIFVLKMVSAYYICCMFSKTIQNIFTMEENIMNPDQTAP